MNPRPLWLQPKRIIASTVAASVLMQSGLPAYAAVSQNPAVFTSQPDANVMFSLDDSGSMMSDVIPDLPRTLPANAYNERTGGKFPPTWGPKVPLDGIIQNTYLGGRCNFTVNPPDIPYPCGTTDQTKLPIMWAKNSAFLSSTYYEDNAVSRFLRSSASNPIYYDRRITYVPWPSKDNDKKLLDPADPKAVKISYHDPMATTGVTTIDLTVEATSVLGTGKFYPATYYVYTGATPYNIAANISAAQNTSANFVKVEIRSDIDNYQRTPGDARTDCASPTVCTYIEERQNFANWLQYYHSRMLMAKGGVAAAFAQQSSNLRVGFTTINSGTILQGVSTFAGTPRQDFYTNLYNQAPNGGTPLRRAMERVGEYFTVPAGANTTTVLNSPYAFTPRSVRDPVYDCRKSFHILSTDGFWKDAEASNAAVRADNDNFTESDVTPRRKTGEVYRYSDSASGADPLIGRFTLNPFRDTTNSQTNTLADVAAYYWKNDLYPDLANNLSPTARDPAFWQHVTTFTVGLGITGSGAVPGLDNPQRLIDTKQAVNWPHVNADTPETGDDLIRASMVGRGRYFSATSPTVLAAGIASALAEAADQPLTLSNLAPAAQSYQEGSKIYQGTFNPANWYGRLYAFTQAQNGSVDTQAANATWEASNKMPAPAARKIYSYNPDTRQGSLFDFGGTGLTATQKTALDNSTDVLNYLRGDGSKELANGGVFRNRHRYTVGGVTGGVLGDIVNSSPIKSPEAGGSYDKLPAGTPGQALYANYRSPNNTALTDYINTIFVGANDGMLHAFNTNTGEERFAYVPNAVFSVPRSVGGLPERKLKMLTEAGYSHRFTVDGSPQLSDAFFGASDATGEWRSILNATTGAGARAIFVMDVTQPAAGTGGFGPSKILWEYSETSDATAASHMGYNLSYGHVARMANGKWVLMFGNGYDSLTGQAVLFIRDLYTGAEVATIRLGTPGGNGLSQPNFTMKNRTVEFIYAGDLKGNLWKLDMRSQNPSEWKSALLDSNGVAIPLYKGSDTQPITVMPTISFEHPSGGVMLSFGTGKLYEVEDTAATGNINLNPQAIYGIWDKPGETTSIVGTSLLVAQSQSALGAPANAALRGTTSNTVDYSTKRGWFYTLNTGGERVHLNPILLNPQTRFPVLMVAANKPAASVPCELGGSARVFFLDAFNGGAPAFPVLDANNDGNINNSDSGYNVWTFNTMVTRPLPMSRKPSPPGGPELKTAAPSDLRTGALDGGREDTQGAGECEREQTVLYNKVDTTNTVGQVKLYCAAKRVTWRQIQ